MSSELDKVAAVKEQSNLIGEFLDWLQGVGLVLCEFHDEYYYDSHGERVTEEEYNLLPLGEQLVGFVDPAGFEPTRYSTERIIAKFFSIDYEKYLDEREALFREVTNMTRRTDE